MKFLIDNQLPLDLARWLERQGVAAKHVLDLQLNDEKDTAIWQYALQHQFVIVSKDEDFADWVHLRKPCAPVVWIRLGNCRNKDLLEAFARALPMLTQRLASGDFLIEVY